MKRLSLILIALFTVNAWAAGDLTQEMDALGANKDLMKKAKAVDPNNQVRVVQNREVDRHLRLELGVNYGMVATGGDPYSNTTALGGQLDFHITPHWSLGARYTGYNNTLNGEGNRVYSDYNQRVANGEPGVEVPRETYAKNSWLAVANFYPIYGKMNLFDASIAQFDLYLVGGAGQINLSTGSAPLYTAGAGVGVWLSKHIATRFEARWQGYTENVDTGGGLYASQSMNETVISATLSFLL